MISSLSTLAWSAPGFWEMIIIFGIVLLIFGPKSIPSLARSLGQGLREFKNASSKLTDAIDDAAREDDRQKASAASPARQIPPPAPSETVAASASGAPLKETR